MQIVRKKLSADEITPRGTRYNSGTDTVQTTSDGGTTWNDAPALDPRHADSFRNPPLSTSDPRCDAAANMIALLREMVNADIAAANTIAMATAFIGLVTLFFPVLLIADLVLAVAGIIAGIGAIAIEAAFTSDVYDQLLCTFQSHLEADGSMTSTELTDLLTDISTNYDATVSDVIAAHSSTMGEVGWSNAGAAGSETGDCTSCAHCPDFDFTIDDGGFVPGFTYLGTPSAVYVPSVGWQSAYFGLSNGYRLVNIFGTFPEVRVLEMHVVFTISYGVLDNSGDLDDVHYATSGSPAIPAYSKNPALVPAVSPVDLVFTPYTDINEAYVQFYCGIRNFDSSDPGGQVTITRIYGVCP